jgi:hypothetical protein
MTQPNSLHGLLTPIVSQMEIFYLTHPQLPSKRCNRLTTLLKKNSPPDPIKMPLASKQLPLESKQHISFQNHEWFCTLLMTVWTSNMKAIMQCYEEVHVQDGIALWFSFLNSFAGTMMENLIEAYSHLTKSKIQLSNFYNNFLHFTNFFRAPICHLLKAKEIPTF